MGLTLGAGPESVVCEESVVCCSAGSRPCLLRFLSFLYLLRTKCDLVWEIMARLSCTTISTTALATSVGVASFSDRTDHFSSVMPCGV